MENPFPSISNLSPPLNSAPSGISVKTSGAGASSLVTTSAFIAGFMVGAFLEDGVSTAASSDTSMVSSLAISDSTALSGLIPVSPSANATP